MEKIKSPYKMFKKHKKNNSQERVIFADLYKNEIMFMSTLFDDEDYFSVNVKSLEPHYNYGYRYQVKQGHTWENISTYKKIFVEFEESASGLTYSFNKYNQSKKLYVIFSSADVSSKFNYVKTFKNVTENKLFLCDEVIENTKYKCSYYYGYDGNSTYEEKIVSLIMSKAKELNLKKENVILVGSSKGGFASLYYTYKYGFGTAIVGSPTIFLGTQHRDTLFGKKLIHHLTGKDNISGSKHLDSLILDAVDMSENKPHIYYHVGRGENRYSNHAIPFINKIDEENKGVIELDLGEYASHSEVGKYFVQYINEILKRG